MHFKNQGNCRDHHHLIDELNNNKKVLEWRSGFKKQKQKNVTDLIRPVENLSQELRQPQLRVRERRRAG
jgi:hypothetical protein